MAKEGASGDKVYDVIAEIKALGLEKLVPEEGRLGAFARQRWSDKREAGLNDIINHSYAMSYALHSLASFCARDYVSLKGLARFYADRSDRERTCAMELSRYQGLRGGKVVLYQIGQPESEFDHEEKGEALYTMEIVLAIFKVHNEKLRDLNQLAAEENDDEFSDYLTDGFIHPLVITVKKLAGMVTQLRRVGKGHGTWHFDHSLNKRLKKHEVGEEIADSGGETSEEEEDESEAALHADVAV
ncbi:Ferritin [Klebsormidium nitens]|uniref:Ferritin n=1 Tax=Klebsormidium nitens TaxID=105231 RepID=A0A1Y1HY48_KLENI|nr:Ferritin [Klebsormidium nitens]|eukprot:GAQ81881.1 Ferritin [Klebsormidium nitens]